MHKISKKADELFKSPNLEDKQKAIEAYGSIGELEKMDRGIRELIQKDLKLRTIYSDIGDKYHRMYKR